jgi:hypothetical protein
VATKYQHDHPDNRKTSGTVSSTVKDNSVAQGSHSVKVFPHLTHAEWSKQEADIKDTVQLKVNGVYFKDGEPVNFEVFEVDGSEKSIATLKGTISGNAAQVSWKYPVDKNGNISKSSLQPEYYFKCTSTSSFVKSPRLKITGTITIALVDSNQKAVANESFLLHKFSNNIQQSKTGGDGKVKFEKIPIGRHLVKFPDNPLIDIAQSKQFPLPLASRKYDLHFGSDNQFVLNTYFILCSHKIEGQYRAVKEPPFFAVVQSPPKEPDKVHIYTSIKNQLTDANGKALKQEPDDSGFKSFSLECPFAQTGGMIPFFKPKFWEELKKPQEFTINGLPKALTIKSYPPNQYKVSMKFPVMERYVAGSKLCNNLKAGAEKITEKVLKKVLPKFIEPEKAPKGADAWVPLKLPFLPTPLTEKCPVSFEVNGTAIELKVLEALGSILVLMKNLNTIKDFITHKLPKAGWYCEYEVKVMQGTLAFGWGWQEYKDHRAFIHYLANVDLTILSIKIEVGIGIRSFVGVQAFINIEGGITVSLQLERDTPDKRPSISLPFGTTIEASSGARVTVGYTAKIEAKIKSGLEITGGKFCLSTEDGGCSVTIGSIKWTGFKVVASVSPGLGKVGGDKKLVEDEGVDVGSGEREICTLVDEKELLSGWKWPSEEKYEAPFRPTYEKNLETVKKVFAKDKGVSVVRLSGGQEQWLSNEEMSTEVAKTISGIEHIEERSVEGIAFSARQEIEQHYKDITSTKKAMEESQFLRFCREGELRKIVIKAQNQTAILHSSIAE